MKRFLTAIAFLMAGSGLIGANAENGRTDGFKGYWDLHVKGGVAHTVGESKFGELLSPAASAGFGYHFTPVWGLRADFSGWQAKGAAVYPPSIYRFNFVQANADVTIDLTNKWPEEATTYAYAFEGTYVDEDDNTIILTIRRQFR